MLSRKRHHFHRTYKLAAAFFAFVYLVSMPVLDSQAATALGSVIGNFNYTFPVIYGSYDNSINVTSYKSFEIVLSQPAVIGKYYVVTIAGRPTITTEWKYTKQENSKQFVEVKYKYRYGGKEFDFGSVYNQAFMIEGMNTATFTLDIELNTMLAPYWANDGYVYINESQTTINWKPTIYLHEFGFDEIAEAKQMVQIINLLQENSLSNDLIRTELNKILLSNTRVEDSLSDLLDLLSQVYNQNSSDKNVMDNFQQNSQNQSTQLGQLNQENQVNKIDINNASSTVDSNIDMNAVGSSGIVLSSLTGHNKILTMLLGVSAVSLIGYVLFGKR